MEMLSNYVLLSAASTSRENIKAIGPAPLINGRRV